MALSTAPLLLITCEHGGNWLPAEYETLFATSDAQGALASHRGFDRGAAEVAARLAGIPDATLFVATVSRLLVDLNRSIGHPRLFSEYVRDTDRATRDRILAHHYLPHRQRVIERIDAGLAAGHRVVHVASHSFTPVMDGRTRKADIGLLFDPRRDVEAYISRHWQAALKQADPALRVRLNYPYRGVADGLTTALRRRFAASGYVGVELEVNQALVGGERFGALQRRLAETLALVLDQAAATSAARA